MSIKQIVVQRFSLDQEALTIAEDLDAKVEKLLTAAAT